MVISTSIAQKLSCEAEKELTLVVKKLQDKHVVCLGAEFDCFLVILYSSQSLQKFLYREKKISE